MNAPLLSAIHHFVWGRRTFNKDNSVGTYGSEHKHWFSVTTSTLKHQMVKIEEETVSHIMGLTDLVDGAKKTKNTSGMGGFLPQVQWAITQ